MPRDWSQGASGLSDRELSLRLQRLEERIKRAYEETERLERAKDDLLAEMQRRMCGHPT